MRFFDMRYATIGYRISDNRKSKSVAKIAVLQWLWISNRWNT